ncbi:MAG: aminotransferase class III-fold pyridoxal phosphate-dependent enzyme, partial [Myxococcota bacterium]
GSRGEAIHTLTFLGHPIGCAAALAVLDRLERGLCDAVTDRGRALEAALPPLRGAGLMRAVPVPRGGALRASRALLQRGFLVLPADDASLQLTPPVTLSDAQIAAFAAALVEVA